MAGVKGKSGRLTKIEENYHTNLGLKGMNLLIEYVDDPSKPIEGKLDRLAPYLTKMIPYMVKIEDERTDDGAQREGIEALRGLLSQVRQLRSQTAA